MCIHRTFTKCISLVSHSPCHFDDALARQTFCYDVIGNIGKLTLSIVSEFPRPVVNHYKNRGRWYISFIYLYYIATLIAVRGPVYKHGLTLIPTWISNHMPSKVWYEIISPFTYFENALSIFILPVIMGLITCQYWDKNWYMFVKGVPSITYMGHGIGNQ